MLVVDHLQKTYDGFVALEDISFTLRPGEALGLIGANGAGKSTTIKCIIGLLEPTRGKVLINKQLMHANNLKLKRMIGYMPEESTVYEDLDAVMFLQFFAELYKIPRILAEQQIKRLLQELKLDNKPIGTMSKGMKRKLLIARSLLHNPKILVYDEPASGIDPETTEFILSYIKELKKKGKIIIMTGHNLAHVETISDRVIMLKKGKVIFNDTIANIKREKKYVLRYKKDKTLFTKHFPSVHALNETLPKLLKEGASILDFHQEEHTLEEIFLKLVK